MSHSPRVQVVENWADLVGRVVGTRDDPSRAAFAIVEVQVAEVMPVEGFPNLYEWAKGRTVELKMPTDKVRELGLSPGVHVACRARHAGPNVGFVHPDHCTRQ